MRKTVARLLALLIIPLGVILLYALAHEGGHALVALFSGYHCEFEVNFFGIHPISVMPGGRSSQGLNQFGRSGSALVLVLLSRWRLGLRNVIVQVSQWIAAKLSHQTGCESGGDQPDSVFSTTST